MNYDVYLYELKDTLSNIAEIENYDESIENRALFQFCSGNLKFNIGNESFPITNIIVDFDESKKIKSVMLHVIIADWHVQEMWTKLYEEGFFDLDLYPIMYDPGFPTRIFLAPIKIPQYL